MFFSQGLIQGAVAQVAEPITRTRERSQELHNLQREAQALYGKLEHVAKEVDAELRSFVQAHHGQFHTQYQGPEPIFRQGEPLVFEKVAKRLSVGSGMGAGHNVMSDVTGGVFEMVMANQRLEKDIEACRRIRDRIARALAVACEARDALRRKEMDALKTLEELMGI
ncbi:hypothetical protein HDU96_003900 [Phlyctochytrium bullatum]|nr:hypothetical protein HDU96_003900 [Phlyctochytrium bullatum]